MNPLRVCGSLLSKVRGYLYFNTRIWYNSDFFSDWRAFVNLAEDRIAFMKAFNNHASLKACDNLEVRFVHICILKLKLLNACVVVQQ
jgi:hypothetical protein